MCPALQKVEEKVAVELANHAARAGHNITIIVGCRQLHFRDTLLQVKVVCVSKPLRSKIARYFGLFWFWMNRDLMDSQEIIHCPLHMANFWLSSKNMAISYTKKLH